MDASCACGTARLLPWQSLLMALHAWVLGSAEQTSGVDPVTDATLVRPWNHGGAGVREEQVCWVCLELGTDQQAGSRVWWAAGLHNACRCPRYAHACC